MKKNRKPVPPVKTGKAKSTCCKTCGRKPSKKHVELTQEEIDTRKIAMMALGVLLLVTLSLIHI